MNEAEISQSITKTCEGVDVVTDSGNSFFFYNPDKNVPLDHRFPFVTLVTSDLYDQFSHLNRPSIFRLNIGIGKQTFRSLEGSSSLPSDRDSAARSFENASGYDFTALDQVMPHPVYGRMYWVCVLNPSDETFETNVRQCLSEAYAPLGEQVQETGAPQINSNATRHVPLVRGRDIDGCTGC